MVTLQQFKEKIIELFADDYYKKNEIDTKESTITGILSQKADKTNATQSNAGLMSAEDKVKLDEMEIGDHTEVGDLDNYYTKSQCDTRYSITVEKQSTADTGFSSTYVIKQNDTQKGVKINIPKDFLVKSATVKTCTTTNQPIQGYAVGDIYIDFIINSKDSTDSDEHLYLAAKEIGAYPVDEITLTVTNGKLAIKDNGVTWAKLATAVQNTINGKEVASNKVTSVSASSTNTQYPSAKCVYDTFCQKNDSRLSDARTPTSHTHTKAEISNFPTSMTPTSHSHTLNEISVSAISTATDFNTLKTQGFYKFAITEANSSSNHPTNRGGLLEVKILGFNAGIAQTYYEYNNGGTKNVYYRTYHNDSGWDNWSLILNSNNYSTYVSPKNHTHKDEDILYNSSTQDKLTPLDMAFVSNANRLAYLPANRIQIWTTIDGGSTWNKNVGTNAQKINLVTTENVFTAGNGSTTNYGQNQIRISLAFGDANQNSDLYATVSKLLLRIGTHGASGASVTVYTKKYGDTNNYTQRGIYYLEGWTGWNAIPLEETVGGYAGQTDGSTNYIQEIVLHFKQNSNSTGNLKIYEIKMIGEKIHNFPSQLSKSGHLYGMNENQDAIFPAKIIKSGGTSSQFLKADGSVDTNAYLTHATKTEYITSTHTSSTSTWTGTSSTISSIEKGTMIIYRLNQAPATDNVTLNLTLKNGTTTGAKGVYIGGTTLKNQFPKHSVIMMIYDGVNWIVTNEAPQTTPCTVTYTDGTTSTINFVTR